MYYFPDSELIINPDGSIYHLHLLPEQIADTIIFVGDQNRVADVSKHFSKIDTKVQNREFVTHTGEMNGQRISVISTGIGTDNIDIVLNELDALVNIDFENRTLKSAHKSLNIIRIGTSGALQSDILVDTFLLNTYAIGLDGLMHFYELNSQGREADIHFQLLMQSGHFPIPPYVVSASKKLYQQINRPEFQKGITATCTGFYAPQGRQLRGEQSTPDLLSSLHKFQYEKFRIANFEMETAGIYGLARVLGHEAISVSAILANRITNDFSKNAQETVDKLIELVLENVSTKNEK